MIFKVIIPKSVEKQFNNIPQKEKKSLKLLNFLLRLLAQVE